MSIGTRGIYAEAKKQGLQSKQRGKRLHSCSQEFTANACCWVLVGLFSAYIICKFPVYRVSLLSPCLASIP